MARSASSAPAIAILGVVACAIFQQLQRGAFVSPLSALGTSSHRLHSSVTLAASKAEVMEAEKQVKLLTWAYETAVAKGMPQADMMKTKADQAVAALEALKESSSAPSLIAPAAVVSSPPASAPEAAAAPAMAPAAPTTASKTEIIEAEKQAKLLTWAYETALAQGMPQAAAAKARADQAVAKLQALKAQAEGSPASPTPVSSMPVPVAAPAIAPAPPTSVSKAELAEAEKRAKLLTWAYETAVAQGMPQAASAKARADQAVAHLQALKAQAEGSPALSSSMPPASVSAPPVAAPAAAAAVPAEAPEAHSGTNKLRMWVAEKRAKLFMWAATTAADKGIPQAAMIKAKADQVVAAFEALKEQAAPKNMVLG